MSIETQPRGELVIQICAMPADTNANGDIFGGWLVAHMDMGAAIAARQRARSRVVTVGIEALSFLKPVYVGDTVCCYADVIKVGHTSVQLAVEVWTVTLQELSRRKVAEGKFTFVAIDENRKPHAVDR